MSAGHTPGPWKVTIYPAWKEGGEVKQDLCAYIDSATGQSVTHVFCEQDLSLRDANARLIAAAPELLTLLYELIDIEGPQPGTSAWANKARAIIAKATGETP